LQLQDRKCGTVSRSRSGQQMSASSDDYWKLTIYCCITVL